MSRLAPIEGRLLLMHWHDNSSLPHTEGLQAIARRSYRTGVFNTTDLLDRLHPRLLHDHSSRCLHLHRYDLDQPS